MTQHPLIRRYLVQMDVSLGRLPHPERQEILLEIESHIAEALTSGRSVAEVLDRLGPADRLARAYTAEAILKGNTGPGAGRWFAVAGVLTLSGLPSLFIIPTLGAMGLAFPLGSFALLLALLVDTFFPYGQNTLFGPWTTGWHIAAIMLAVLLAALGWGAITLLRLYINFMLRTVRKALS